MNILWDFDGTLFDTYPAYTKVLHTVLGDEYDKNEIYKKLKVSYSHAMEHYQVSNEKQDEMTALRIDLHPSEMKPFDHVEEILKYADKNVIMTHKDRAGVSAILKHYGWENYFKDIVTIDDGFARKPHPESYIYLHEKHRIDLAIGDRELDLLPAKELGIPTCLFQAHSDIADFHLEDYSEFFTLDLDSVKRMNQKD
ncbi:HAD-IA family hydrolase [Rossellomorea vietnamensis]|uniref:HAD-IA family hydrolase n=1 Tax=Rossellomorea vietnamensis TaxID=218284 RepID=A0A5D4MIE8_9BACI|nr:HAD-IA family hydrolase [Rossellomorea vietnamensis]TYS01169.1 HAD-IA family hydrolase [Rossellomorea vietnamensis]